MRKLSGWPLVIFLLLLGAPARVEAVFVRETAWDILNMRGMIPAITICLVGILLLRYVPASPELARGKREGRISRRSDWVILFAYISVVYATVPFGFEVVTWIVKRIGILAFRYSLNGVGLVAGLFFLWHVIGKRRVRSWAIYLRLAMILAVYVYFFLVLEVPVKRMHFLEYSFLSALVFQALRPFTGPPGIYLWITLGVMGVGVGEEGLSLFFPRRYAAVSDVIWDTTAGVLGAVVLKFILLKS